ncbi:MAG: N-acetylmuramic acid 6-phosphate etherase [Tepidisphaeraceae bacterium]|jgi:N-acetylmuramic acid 6-phosphate etherase
MRSHLLTEQRLPESMDLDVLSVSDAIDMMHQQDLRAVQAVGAVREQIAAAVQLVADHLGRGGRLFYVGAGTSGRLGVLDASECPPTFRCDPEMVQGIMAGGNDAMFRSKEGAEDSSEGGAADMDARRVGPLDVVMGIASGGTTPYVHGALRRAIELGAGTIFFSCVQPVPGEASVDVVIRPLTGPEVVTGSTRLKAGTATKLVLNMISTLSMVRLGKVYENLMVDLRASNTKLRDRAARIICMLAGCSREEAVTTLDAAGGHVKLAVLMRKADLTADAARQRLVASAGRLRGALGETRP